MPDRTEHHGHRARDVLAEPTPRLEQEVVDGVDALGVARDVQVVDRVRAEPRLIASRAIVVVRAARRDLQRERPHACRQRVGELQVAGRQRGRRRPDRRGAGSPASFTGTSETTEYTSPSSSRIGERIEPDRSTPEPRRREVDRACVRGGEEHVRLRRVDVERLRRSRPSRAWPPGPRPGPARTTPSSNPCATGSVRSSAIVQTGPVVGVEHLGTPQCGLRRAHAERDLVRQAPARAEVHDVAEPRVGVGREVHDPVAGRRGEPGILHGPVEPLERSGVPQRERRGLHEGARHAGHREEHEERAEHRRGRGDQHRASGGRPPSRRRLGAHPVDRDRDRHAGRAAASTRARATRLPARPTAAGTRRMRS